MPSAPLQSQSQSLFAMARSKLNTAVSGVSKDSSSLHRWVLLKNSILRSHSVDPAPPPAGADVQHVYRRDDEEARDEVEEDAFMFPDPHALGSRSSDGGDSEKQWLDSLLEDLGDDDDYADAECPAASNSSLPVDDDDEQLSPLCSPNSSSDDLVGPHSSLFYQPPPIAIPYPVPYPPLPPSWLQLDSHDHDPLPYFDADEDLCVPDAIEDTSDDESDALSTPYTQSVASLSPTDPASVPLPTERTRLRGHPHVYVESDSDYFYPFELDPPLPFHDEDHSDTARVFRPPVYQEC